MGAGGTAKEHILRAREQSNGDSREITPGCVMEIYRIEWIHW